MWLQRKCPGLWPWLGLLLFVQGPWLVGTRVAAAPSALKVHYDCGEQGLQLLASLVPWPPGDRLTFNILDEFGNGKTVEDCWACKHWVTKGPQGQALLVIKYSGCYVDQRGANFQIKVRILQQSNSSNLTLSEDVTVVCPKPVAEQPITSDNFRQLPVDSTPTNDTPLQQRASPTTGAPLQQRASPTTGAPLQQRASPTTGAPLQQRASPTTGAPLQQRASPTTGAPLQQRALPTLGNVTVPPSVCQVASGKIQCAGASASKDSCLRAGCCYDASDRTTPCYYGNEVTVPPSVCQVASGKIQCARASASKDSCLRAGCCYDASDRTTPCYYGNEVTVPPSVCQVASGKIQCAEASDSKDSCLRAGCCYDASDRTTPCYYGNKATTICTPDGFFLLVVSRDLLGQPVLLDTLHLADTGPACQPQVVTSSFRLFRFPLSQCGTTVQLLSDRVVYENELTSIIDVRHSRDGSITRDVLYTLRIRCSYTTADTLPVVAEVFTLPPPSPITEAGPLRLEMRIAKDALYSMYYSEAEYPVVRILRDPIFLEVRLLQRTDPSLTLVLNDCWAGQTTNPVREPQWPMLLDGCPFAGDNYQTHPMSLDGALQFPSHYSRFTVSTFTFVDAESPLSNGGLVYFFCSASVCRPSPAEPCTPFCLPPRARRKRFLGMRTTEDQPVDVAVAPGAVILQESPVVERKQELLEPRSTMAPVLDTWLPVAAGVATGMAVTLLAMVVLCWRRLGEAVIALAMQD